MSMRHFYRLTFIIIVLVLGLTTLQTSYAQRPLSPTSPVADSSAAELSYSDTQSSYAKRQLPQTAPAADSSAAKSGLHDTQSSYAERPLLQNHILAAANEVKLTETFDTNAIPTDWQVINSPTGSPGWRFDDPKPRNNQTGGADNMAIADSDYEGKVDIDTSLVTKVLNLSSADTVKLQFKTYFKPYQTSTADVDVSVDGGTTWTNLWRKKGVFYQGTVNLDVPQAVNKSSVQFRFHHYDTNWDYYWQVDDVKVEIPTAPAAPSTLNAVESGNDVNLTWADNSDNETSFILEHSPNGTGSWIEAGKLVASTTTFTHKNVGCGTTIYYRMKALNGNLASGYSNTANITMTACPSSTVGIDEDFNAAQNLPDGWTIPDPPWSFDQPNTTGGTGNAAFGHPVQAELHTPVFNMKDVNAVYLKFKTDIKFSSGTKYTQNVFVDISQDGGTTWETVWSKNSSYKGEVNIEITKWAADKNNLKVRFRHHLSYSGTYFQIDDVKIASMPAPPVPTGLTATRTGNSDVLLGWNGTVGASYIIERSADNGTTWNQVADMTNGATSYEDTTVKSNTAYQYQVRAYNAAGQSANSTAAGVTTGDKSIRYIDVTVSLYPTATLTTAIDRAKYENIIGYFADGVYEASNGVNRIRTVTIYRNQLNFDSAHIQWIPKCHPNASTGGYIRPGTGARVEMCDIFKMTSSEQDYLVEQKAGGYGALVHEWGHYFYGLYDEYKGDAADTSSIISTRSNDIPSTYSIMRSSDYAVGSPTDDLRWLNFSAQTSHFSKDTAQGRVFGASSWEVMARPKNEDPQNSYAANRPYWPELAAVAPISGTLPSTELPNAAARAQLQIVWKPGFPAQTANNGLSADIMAAYNTSAATVTAANSVIREIVIDRSAMMAESGYLDEAKSAVAALIEQSAVGDTIGILAFDGTVTEVYPLTDITNDTVKAAIVTAVNNITAGNTDAAGGDALQTALDTLTDPSVPIVSNQAVYFITGGYQTSGVHPTTVVPGYQDNYIPLQIFGFDPIDSAEADLRLLADLTEGEYTTVFDVTDMQKALRFAEQDTSNTQDVTLAYEDADVAAGEIYSYTVAIDETMNEVDFEFIYFSEPYSVTIELEDPQGGVWPIDPATDCETYDSGTDDVETSCYIGFYDPYIGNWTVYAQGQDDFFIVDIETGVAAIGDTTYDAVITAVDGDVVEYPRPIVVEAGVSRSYRIGGLHTYGWIYGPDGSKEPVNFRDDGVAPDLLGNDGIYTAYVDYYQDGEHWVTVHFDNYDGNGFYTDESIVYMSTSDWVDPGPLPAVTESFERYAEVQLSVSGWQEDDHADWPDDPEFPITVLTLDNTQVPGRIDFANDVDMFEVTVPADYAESTLGLRVNRLGLGMDPYVVVYAADYSWEFTRYLDFVPTADDALFIPIDVNPGETFYVEVWHYDETGTGTYNISAGKYLWSDPIEKPGDKPEAEPAVITILGDNPATVEVGDSYTDAGATAYDGIDGDLTADIVTTSDVDANTVGDYSVTYEVTDSDGNIATAVRTVNVVDTTAPVITILGDNPATVEVGDTYTDAGATASDVGDGDLTADIVTTSDVDASVVGNYSVTYDVTDSSGNSATAVRTVNVVDTTAPVITILGDNPATVEVGSTYTDAGATASDVGDGDLTADIVTTIDVDTSTVGDYSVTYEVTDSSGNSATAERTVNVVDTGANRPVADAGGSYLGKINTSIQFDGSGSSDPNGDPLTYLWDFGDGSTGTGTAPTHSYDKTGIYDVCLTVNDGVLDSEPSCTEAVVYNPKGSLARGKGWYYSEAGAFTPALDYEGYVKFNTRIKYKRNSDILIGKTVFQSGDRAVTFRSTGYEWLVVTDEGMAIYKGTGTINGEGEFQFMVWAGDSTGANNEDTIRLKVWWEDGDGEHLVYDNGWDQPIDSGFVTVRKGKN